jgi:phosphinothricin acetyltransferase
MEYADLHIRLAALPDLPAIVEIYNQGVQDGTSTCDLSDFTPDQMREWFDQHQGRYPIWTATANNTVLGWTALSPYAAKSCFDHTAMFSTYIHREARGKYIGTALRRHLIDEARRLGFHTILNRVFVINDRSIALAKKFGFTQVGYMREIVYRNGVYIDCVFFQLILDV